jgi:hypothetical protein
MTAEDAPVKVKNRDRVQQNVLKFYQCWNAAIPRLAPQPAARSSQPAAKPGTGGLGGQALSPPTLPYPPPVPSALSR